VQNAKRRRTSVISKLNKFISPVRKKNNLYEGIQDSSINRILLDVWKCVFNYVLRMYLP
jgi:hypothetical protein